MGLLNERGLDNTPRTYTHTLSPPLYTPWGKGEGYNFSFFLEMILFSLTACLLPGLRTIGCKDLIFLFFFFFYDRERSLLSLLMTQRVQL